MPAKTLPQLEQIRTRLLARLATEQQRTTGVVTGLGHGYAMRAYHRLKNLSFGKEDNLRERVEEVERQLRALGWTKPGEAPAVERSEEENLRHYCEVMGLPLP